MKSSRGGFHMVKTRAASNKMEISADLQEYFSDLIAPLATNEDILKMFDEFKVEVIDKFEQKLNNQEDRIVKLESTLALRENTIEKLLVACDNNEQYSRRSCLRINGIETEKEQKEDNKSVIDKVKVCYDKLGVDFDHHAIDRAHRIGKKFVDKDGVETQQIIVKFRSWIDRRKLYIARPKKPKVKVKSKEKPPSFRIVTDLTKRRYELLRKAKGLIDDDNANFNVKFAFADINCSLVLFMNDESFRYFNSEEELMRILYE